MADQHELLETLHRLVGCEYLSDLKNGEQRERLLRVIDEMDASRFPLPVWSGAVSYLFQMEVCFLSFKELRAFVEEQRQGLL